MVGIPVNKKRKIDAYNFVWEIVLKQNGNAFKISDICKQSNLNRSNVRDYIQCYCNGGYIERIGKSHDGHTYRVVRAVKRIPRLNRKGLIVGQGQGQDHLWRTMKMMGRFTKHDLALHASTDSVQIKVSSANNYIKTLNKAGYIAVTKESKPGKPAEYVFLNSKNTGSKAPMIQRVKNVYDPNLKKVVWTSQESGNE